MKCWKDESITVDPEGKLKSIFQSETQTWVKVRASLQSAGFILWGTWTTSTRLKNPNCKVQGSQTVTWSKAQGRDELEKLSSETRMNLSFISVTSSTEKLLFCHLDGNFNCLTWKQTRRWKLSFHTDSLLFDESFWFLLDLIKLIYGSIKHKWEHNMVLIC